MLQATATLVRATTITTGSKKTHCYEILVVTSRGQLLMIHVSTAKARSLGFSGLREQRKQTIQGWWYPAVSQFEAA
jgi:hypothetical protein